jgi:phosphatidylserine/phosphatidylglycerophosphate/cardiolipin synthase-like enzyme
MVTMPNTSQGVTMTTRRTLWALVALFVLAIGATAHATDLVLNDAATRILFSPGGRCTEAIVAEINSAKTEILVQAYSLTSSPIADAVVEAHKRGVKVNVILDKSRNKSRDSKGTILVNRKIPVFIDGKHPTDNNKIIIIDRQTVITGSFNFTKEAESNAENLLIINSAELAKPYLADWDEHRKHSEVFEQRD